MLLGTAHYPLVPVVVAAGVGGVGGVAGVGDAAVVVVAVAAAAAAGTDAAVAGNHRADSDRIAVVLAEDEEGHVPAVCADSLAAVEPAPKNAVVAVVRTELEAAVVAAWVLAVAAALAAAGSLEQGTVPALTSAL